MDLFPSLKHLHLNHNSYSGMAPTPLMSRQASSITRQVSGINPQSGNTSNLLMRVLDVNEQANRDIGLTFLAHLLLYPDSPAGGKAQGFGLNQMLSKLKVLDMRGLHLPAWFTPTGAPGRPACLLTDPQQQFLRSSSASLMAAQGVSRQANMAAASTQGIRKASGPLGGKEVAVGGTAVTERMGSKESVSLHSGGTPTAQDAELPSSPGSHVVPSLTGKLMDLQKRLGEGELGRSGVLHDVDEGQEGEETAAAAFGGVGSVRSISHSASVPLDKLPMGTAIGWDEVGD